MKTISLNVAEPAYEELKALADKDGRPVAELVRQSMQEYIDRRPLDRTLDPHDAAP